MEGRPNCAQSAQLLMARHAWFWHAATLTQTASVTCVCKGGETKQFQKSFEPSQWWSSDNVVKLWVNESERTAKWQATQITLISLGRHHGICCMPTVVEISLLILFLQGIDWHDWKFKQYSLFPEIIYQRCLHIYCFHVYLKLWFQVSHTYSYTDQYVCHI